MLNKILGFIFTVVIAFATYIISKNDADDFAEASHFVLVCIFALLAFKVYIKDD